VPLTNRRGFAVDLAAAAVVTVAMIVAVLESADQPARPVDAWVFAALGVLGAWTAFARRAPRVALAGSCLTFYTALAAGVPAFSPALALGVPVLVAAWSGYLWWAVTVLGVIGATSAPYRLLGPGAEPWGQVALSTLFDLSLLAVLLLLGEALRSRRAVREEAALRLLLAEQEHQRRLTEERLRAARDLHDVLAHTVAVVGIQAGVAAETIDTDPTTAKQAVARVRAATREATADLRSTIAVLRQDTTEDRRDPAPGTHQLPELLETVRASGLDARLSLHGDIAGLRPSTDLVLYRIVQESLTNVLRHSTATTVEVTIDYRTDAVDVVVRDNGTPRQRTPPHPDRGGSGLRGMAERVTAVGGRLTHGPAPDGAPGYRVHAQLPLGGRP
jgi:signal transduction histidine kinase